MAYPCDRCALDVMSGSFVPSVSIKSPWSSAATEESPLSVLSDPPDEPPSLPVDAGEPSGYQVGKLVPPDYKERRYVGRKEGRKEGRKVGMKMSGDGWG